MRRSRARKVRLVFLTVVTIAVCGLSCVPTPYYRLQSTGYDDDIAGVWSVDISLYCGNLVSNSRFWSTAEGAPAPGWGWYEYVGDTDFGWELEHGGDGLGGCTHVNGIAFWKYYTQRPQVAIRAPMWLPLALVLLVSASKSMSRKQRIATRLANRQCVACGYSLIGNISGVCPECGNRADRSASASIRESIGPMG
ncbi:MAG: hypothetical protein AMXMBFR47_34570 [Planctomycetota bacterium]